MTCHLVVIAGQNHYLWCTLCSIAAISLAARSQNPPDATR